MGDDEDKIAEDDLTNSNQVKHISLFFLSHFLSLSQQEVLTWHPPDFIQLICMYVLYIC